jgi:Glycosyl transferase family 2/Glycosyl transferases group 1
VSTRARVFAHHLGNVYMREIALWIVDGLRELDIDAELATLGLPGQRRDTFDFVVAPHEYFVFETAGAALLRECLAHCAVVNTEQPGSQWFDSAVPYLAMAGVSCDLNALGVAAQAAHGIDALEVRPGLVESHCSPLGAEGDKPIDVVFMGSLTPRREAVLADMADVLSAHECRLLLFEASKPIEADTDDHFVAGSAKADLLARTRVMLNIHRSDDTGYFEWHRVLPAVANGAVILTEPSEATAPLRHGVHLVEAPTADLSAYLVGLLRNEEQRRSIARAARSQLQADHAFARALERTLARLRELRPAPVTPAARSHAHVVVMERVRRHLLPRAGSPVPTTPPLDEADRVRFALKRSLLQQRQLINLVAHDAPHATQPVATNGETATPAAAHGPAPDVSVVVPLYNHAGWIGNAIRSAASSVGVQAEIVVVDDGSTDDSAPTVQELIDANPAVAVRLLRHTENRGLAAARNTGFANARADLVFLLDADNELTPHGLARLVRAARDSGGGFAYGVLAAFGDESRLVSSLPWDVARLCAGPYIDAMALIHRATWERVGGYSSGPADVAYGWEDYQFWLGCAAAGIRGTFVPELVGRYRVRHGSMLSVTNVDTREIMHYFRHTHPELPWPQLT